MQWSVQVLESLQAKLQGYGGPLQWAWIDPGAFALVGAGAFMGGVTRLTVALAVIMIEVRGKEVCV